MHAILKTSLLGILSYIVYNYIVIPLSLPELEDFRKHSGNLTTFIDKTIVISHFPLSGPRKLEE